MSYQKINRAIGQSINDFEMIAAGDKILVAISGGKDSLCMLHFLKEFQKITTFPILLNTSFNVNGEPIVCTPDDAISTFYNSKIDVLVIGDYMVKKI